MLATETRFPRPSGATSPTDQPALDWKQIVEPVEPFLGAVASQLEEQVNAFDPEIAEYARYALSNQGKRLRPALVALSAGLADAPADDLVRVAVIIEMVHLATLVHDDVMDHAEMRRRRPTVVANWGGHVSVLLGDCLFAHALKLAAGFPTPEICRAVASASNTVCSGEILQTHRRMNFSMPREEYFKVVAMKTAEFFALSCDLGAHLSGAAGRERSALRDYGMALGIAYQIYDDCLDLFGSEADAGKSLGTDLAGGKLTLPVLIALEEGAAQERELLEARIRDWQPEFHAEVILIMERCQALQASRNTISDYLARATEALACAGNTGDRGSLQALAVFLGQQTDALGGKPWEA